ncbi:gpW family head-tail joining protein [Hydrogenovibrio sp. 3SP14C1]|uniref:gpW family head-tail joining protein n=1 Tax=Hydrogenovibrio sp. 3SP14C1 TaxID=3038774 RepID=UPI002417ACC0|nr:gpW family head-tail joining protein [Hydrogenovibrio sp. 3SP14C1]MDG4811923.1 gpW family head-tail joining protein [Hydrogenovibrio sp. 3SP14C1]
MATQAEIEAATTRRDNLQAAYDALLMGDRAVEVKFENESVTYQQASAKLLKDELVKAKKLVNQLTGVQRGRPTLIKHKAGY